LTEWYRSTPTNRIRETLVSVTWESRIITCKQEFFPRGALDEAAGLCDNLLRAKPFISVSRIVPGRCSVDVDVYVDEALKGVKPCPSM
jgi:hypothetical protein